MQNIFGEGHLENALFGGNEGKKNLISSLETYIGKKKKIAMGILFPKNDVFKGKRASEPKKHAKGPFKNAHYKFSQTYSNDHENGIIMAQWKSPNKIRQIGYLRIYRNHYGSNKHQQERKHGGWKIKAKQLVE